MSRSYRKHTVVVVASGFRGWGKRQANRRLRRYAGDTQDGGWWRRLYQTWKIVDWRSWWREPNRETEPEKWLRWRKDALSK